jgi:hypothetical protein
MAKYMRELSLHPFLDLDRTPRSRWIAAFCDKSLVPPLGIELMFPLLPRGESPLSWLEDQFRRAEVTGRKPDRLRDSVVDLILRELEGVGLTDRSQVLGSLVDLASLCGFTEIAPKLRDWIRGDRYAFHTYNINGHNILLRQTLWSTIIAWGLSEDMIPYLKRDLGRPKLESGALCFSALGRLSPADAITEIPTMHNWPEPYWRELLREFFDNFSEAARTLSDPRLLSAWRSCLRDLLWDPETSESFNSRWGEFRKLLDDAGLELNEILGEDRFYLRPKERPSAILEIDLEPFVQETDQSLMNYYYELLGSYALTSGAQGVSP